MHRLEASQLNLIGQFLGPQSPPQHQQQPTNTVAHNHRRYAYVTMLTSDSFLPGVKALITSMRIVHSAYPLIVIITSSLSEPSIHEIHRLGVECKIVQSIPVAPKLSLWTLIDFERVLYIDADCIVLSNLDHLFATSSSFAAAPDIFPPDRFNAGVLLVKPSLAVYQDMLEKIPFISSYDDGDTGFLNAYFPSWFTSTDANKLPFSYNAQRSLYRFMKSNPRYWEICRPIHILHFSSGPKPWENPMSASGDLEWIWWQVYQGDNMTNHPLIRQAENMH